MMFTKLKNYLKKHAGTELAILIIAIVSALCMIPMLKGPLSGHDTDFHLASIYSLASSGKFNLFDVKIFDNMAGNFGYGAGIFYPQLLHIVSAYIYRLASNFGIGLYKSTAISYWLFLSASGIIMYFLLRKFTKSNKVAIFASLLYVVLPYHLSDILIRDAMAEVGLFIFMPLICLGLYYLAQKNYVKYFVYFVLGGVGLINSHLVVTIFIVFCLIIFILAHWRTFITKKNILYLIAGAILIVAISAPFLAPMIQHRLGGDYTVFLDGYMINDRTNNNAHIKPKELLIAEHKYRGIVYSLNIAALIVIIYGLFNLKKLERDRKRTYIWLSAITIICTAFSCGIINITKWPNSLHMIQFAWRLMTIVCFTFAFLLAIAIEMLPKKVMYFAMVLIMIFAAWSYSGVIDNIQPYKGRRISSLSRVTKRYCEYYPVALYRHPNRYAKRKFKVVPLSGVAKISKSIDKLPALDFSVKTNGSTLELPRIFYYGYEIRAHYDDGTTELLSYQESPLGFIQFDLQKDAMISVRYTGGAVLKISQAVSVFAILMLFVGAGGYSYLIHIRNTGASYLAFCKYPRPKAKRKK
ncbi:hypothetical protein J6X15_03335 [Candidatus Saccharibacteria bacterium]|nr:hypothetical protein [Candidatus Saccharibacteria bacterium]